MNIIEAMADPALFKPWFKGASWNGWRTVLKAANGMKLTAAELEFFHTVAGDRDPPKKRVRELWIVVGRRGGKDSIASLIVAHAAALFDPDCKLRPGERASCLCLAADRDQAAIVLNYTRAYFDGIPFLADMIQLPTKKGFELTNSVDVTISTNSFRAVRGRTILAVVLDECAFYRDDTSANPDIELYRALTPGMATLSEAMLIGISTPYRRSGLLFEKWRDHFGHDSDDTLIIQAASEVLNPVIDRAVVAKAFADDPIAASAEYGATFRSDVTAFLPREIVEGCIEPGTTVRPPVGGITYTGFCDAASGTGTDSFVVAVSHKERNDIVLDLVHEIKPKFNPNSAIAEVADIFGEYGISRVKGDAYAPGFVESGFAANGLRYVKTAFNRSELYTECLPLLTAGRAKLIDNDRMVAQFAQLERRTSPGGQDTINHPKNGHDDLANAVAGALVEATSALSGGIPNADLVLARLRSEGPRRYDDPQASGEISWRYRPKTREDFLPQAPVATPTRPRSSSGPKFDGWAFRKTNS